VSRPHSLPTKKMLRDLSEFEGYMKGRNVFVVEISRQAV